MAEVTRERKLQVLRAIVEEYVAHSEPVGSKAIAARYGLGVSAATIRTDMAALELAGLIHQPHTSAGRIPTDAGYRLFVDQLAPEKPLSEQQRTAISRFLAKSEGFDDLLSRAGRLIAELTGQIAIVQYPPARAATLRHLELVALPPTGDAYKVLVIVITDSGRVIQQVITQPLDEGESTTELAEPEVDLDQLGRHLNSLGIGQPLSALAGKLPQLIPALPTKAGELAVEIGAALAAAESSGTAERLVVSGTANATRREQTLKFEVFPLLEALEEQVTILALLAEMKAEAHVGEPTPPKLIQVRIGAENNFEPLTGAAVVTADYHLDAQNLQASALVGSIGPTRIDYPATIASVRGVADYLNTVFPA